MPVISIFSAFYCNGDEVATKVSERLGHGILSEDDIIRDASQRYNVPVEKLKRAMHGPPSVFGKFTHEKERNIAYLRSSLAGLLQGDDLVLRGFTLHLIPAAVPHVLKVCLVAGVDYRVQTAMQGGAASEKEVRKAVAREDTARAEWTRYLFELGPWDSSLYDLVIPMDKTTVADAVDLICENAAKPVVQRGEEAERAIRDFMLASQVNIVLARKGHDVGVTSENGKVTIIINKYVVRLENLERELTALASAVEGVQSVTTRVGPKFHQPGIYLNLDAEMPSKILLVDDEKEFVHTLSERLQSRNLSPAIAYNGEEALSIIESDEPEVVVLDLQMPGIHGIEVLRRVKKGHPMTEVIILTGHGSEKEREAADELGAFAYLRKPVDIKVLSDTMKEAYQKQRQAKAESEDGGNADD